MERREQDRFDAREQGADVLQGGTSYPIWTPLDAFDAAESLQELLELEQDVHSYPRFGNGDL